MEQCKTTDMQAWVKEKYQEVQKLINKHEAKNGPNELHKRKCTAVNILKKTLEALTKDPLYNTMAAITYLNIGILQSDMQDAEPAKENLEKCINLLIASKLTPEGILPTICANNEMGIIYAQQGVYAKATDFLEKAQNLYIKFTEDAQLDPVNMLTIMGIEEIEGVSCPKSILEKLHTLTLYYFAQVCREQEDKEGFALYCHKTLSKQLSLNSITQDLDYVEWALNAATVSQYFLENYNFPQARHHLAAASYILQKYSEILQAKGDKETSESVAAQYETFDHRSADIARCWAKYGIVLLGTSMDRLLAKAEDDQSDSDSEWEDVKDPSEIKKYPMPKEQVLKGPTFVDLEPELEAFHEITDQYLLDFDDAKPVFLNVRKWLDKAKAYYTFEDHASDYVSIAKDASMAYKYLAFYEDDGNRQTKMHKRRIDILEEISQGLNPRFYRALCREIWIELADTYSEMLDIKIDCLRQSNAKKLPAQTFAKIERLAKSSIRNYQSYVESLDTNKNENGVESFSDEDEFQALYCYFYIGRLYNKIVTSDLKQKIENMQNSLNAYGFVVRYCDEHSEKQKQFQNHKFIEIANEFYTLLPLTLRKYKQKLQQMNQ